MTKVLVSDNLGEDGVRLFEEEPTIDVDVKTGLAPEALEAIIADYDALVIRSATKVTEALLQAAKRLKVVGRAGIGLDNVDIPAATRRGVVVMNTPTGNVITTAEHAVAMMLALSRNIPMGTASLRDGRWEKKKLQGREIFNKVLGVIGYGKIGAIVADRARGLKMNVIVHDPFVTPEQIQKAGFESVDLDTLYQRSDYISVHVPKLKTTVGMINRAGFEKMKTGVMVINCARGGIVDENDLYEAIVSGKVAGAALDVFATEPPGLTPLITHERVIGTPHLGASTLEAQTNVAVAIARQIIDFFTTGTVANAVNMPAVSGEMLERVGPYLTLAERMGCLQAQLVKGPIKEVIVEFQGDFKELDLSPVPTAVLKGILAPVVKDDVNFVNAHILAQQRGIKVTETSSADSDYYVNQITVRAITTEMESVVSGTIFGKKDPRVVKINKFRLEMIPQGHMALIQNIDKPGSIGEIGTTLGRHQINIGKMQVGQEEDGDRNIIFLTTDTPIPEAVLAEMRQLSLVKTVTPLEF